MSSYLHLDTTVGDTPTYSSSMKRPHEHTDGLLQNPKEVKRPRTASPGASGTGSTCIDTASQAILGHDTRFAHMEPDSPVDTISEAESEDPTEECGHPELRRTTPDPLESGATTRFFAVYPGAIFIQDWRPQNFLRMTVSELGQALPSRWLDSVSGPRSLYTRFQIQFSTENKVLVVKELPLDISWKGLKGLETELAEIQHEIKCQAMAVQAETPMDDRPRFNVTLVPLVSYTSSCVAIGISSRY